MKKFLSLLMVLALALLPVLSLAEAAEEIDVAYTTYTHTTGSYSFMYPENWFLLNAENIQAILESTAESGNAELAQLVEAYGPQIQQMDMVMVLSETGMTNVNVVCQPVGMQATDEVLLTLAPTLVQQLSSSFEGIEFVDEGSIINLGNKNGMMVEYNYELAGTSMHGVQVYVSGATDLYVFTYTCTDENELSATAEDFGFMLGSLTVQ